MNNSRLSRTCALVVALLLTEGSAFTLTPSSGSSLLSTSRRAVVSKQQQQRAQPLTMVQSTSTTRTAPPSMADLDREIVSLGRRGLTDEALAVYHAVPTPTIRLLNSAIDACSRARPARLDEAFALLKEGIETKGLTPNVFTFGSLVSTCSRARQARRAIQVLRSMEKDYGVKPNAIVYSTAISACSREAKADPVQYKTALSLLAEAEDKGLGMSVVGYNAALGACSHAGAYQAAIELFDRMQTEGIVDAVSYGTVMAACENGEEWNLVLKYADLMVASGFALDGLAVTCALHACQQKGLADDALRYLDIMKTSPKATRRKTYGMKRMGARTPLEGPDDVAYRLAISACARGGNWEKGVQLLGEMREVTGKADVIAYTAAITGCEYAGEWKKAFSVLEMMRKDGVEPNEVTMAAIIGACATACNQGTEDTPLALKKALQLFQVMKKDPTVVSPNIAVYNAAIRTCAEANKLDVAFRLLVDAETNGLEPTIVTFGTLMTACERASSLQGMDRVFQLMRDASIVPNEIFYGAAISCLRKSSQGDRAFLLLRKMIKDDLKPNVATFNTVLIAQTEGRKLRLENALTTYKMMNVSENAKPNRQTYSIMIRAMCSNHQPQGAEAFIRRMQQDGIKPDVDLYTLTVASYEKTRQPLRALRIMESMEEVGYDFYSVKVLNTAFKNAVKLVNVVGKSLTESDDDDDREENWNDRIKSN